MAEINLSEGDDDFTQPASQRDEWNNYYGLGGNDTIRLVQGVGVGGPGNDVIAKVVVPTEPWRSAQAGYWSSPTGVRVDLEQGWAEDGFGGRDTLIGIETVHSGGHSDWFRGGSGNNHFFGNGGNDTMIGGAGLDGTSLPWFQPAGGGPWRQALFGDVDVQVSADGLSAVIRPRAGIGFVYTLTDMEYFDAEINGNDSQRFYLTDFIRPSVMAEQAIAAGAAYRWNGTLPLGSPAALTYSFVTTAPSSGVGAAGFRAFTAAEQQVVREVLASAAAIAGLSFTEVSESGSSVGQIRLGVSQQAATRGVTWLPGQPGAGDLAGDIWMDVESMAALAPGGEGRAALVHEIGHALGLRHPRNVDPGDQWAMQLRPADDLTALSVMSQSVSPDGLFRTEWGPLDVLALRYLYGSRSVSTGDTLYRLGDAQAAAQTTITDDGGTDTLDASAYTTGVRLSLVAGSRSDVGFTAAGFAGIGNLALTSTTLIENAVGSSADDVLIGNSLSNRLTGGLGNDWIEGGDGVDTAAFAGNRADYRVISNYGKVFVEARDGVSGYDTLLGVERLAFADQTLPVDSVTIGGTAVQGATLTAQAVLGDAATLSALAYRWNQNGTLIAGATGATLVLTEAHVGRLIHVIVDYSDSEGNLGSVTSAATLAVVNANDPPTGSVTISGIAQQGRTLSAANTLVDADGRNLDPDGTPTTQYQWRADGVNIGGAAATSLLLTESLVGKRITVQASYHDQRGTGEVVESAATEPVVNVNDLPGGSIRIAGAPTLGQTLAVVSTLSDADGLGTFGYQWKADGVDIPGATAATLLLGAAQVGKVIGLVVRYVDGHGTPESASAAVTNPVASVNAAPTGTVSVTGIATQGQMLAAVNTLSDADGLGPITYQWRADEQPIAFGLGNFFLLTEAQVGKRITVSANYTDARGTLESVTSTATRLVVNLNDLPGGAVVVSGVPTQGRTLTAASSLTDADGLGPISWRWSADGVVIGGATGASFVLTEAQVGRRITATASYLDGHGSTESVTSLASGPVINLNDAPTGTVTLSGPVSPAQGQSLSVNHSLADADGLGTVTYQWKADGVDIAGATGQTILLAEAQVDKAITAVARYTDGHGSAESVSSAATPPVINANDTPTGVVSISGDATLGRTLTASHTLADPDGMGPVSYLWRAWGTAIPGATGSTLLLGPAQQGAAISVTARYVDGHGTEEYITSLSTRSVVSFNSIPTGGVFIDGVLTQGRTLSARHSLTDADGMGTVTYQWQAAGMNIASAIAPSFTLTHAQVGMTITVLALYNDGRGTPETVASAARGPVANLNDPPTGQVSISGIVTQGQLLTAVSDLADIDGLGTLGYQWQAAGAPIAGATGSVFRLTESQVGKAITVVVGYTDGQGSVESVTSAATAPVGNLNDAPTGALSIVGEPTRGTTLTVSSTLADPDGLGGFSHQWKAAGVDIAGATGASFTLTDAQVGQAISVTVRYTDGHGSLETVTSDATAPAAIAINGTGGPDSLTGSASMDWMRGLAGNDWLSGGAGADTVDGGAGDDTLGGGAGSDTVIGGDGYDRALFGVDDGRPAGSRIDLNFRHAAWTQSLFTVTDANGQTDSLVGIEAVQAVGGPGDDSLVLGPGDDFAHGNAGSDHLRGGAGADSLMGGDNGDWLMGGSGNDTIDGGAGPQADHLEYNDGGEDPLGPSIQGIVLDLATGIALDNWGDTDVLRGIENVGGSSLDDWMSGDAFYNALIGNAGHDTLIGAGSVGDHLEGGGGNDSLVGGTGGDWLMGGSGNDTLDGGTGSASDHLEYNEWGQDPLGPTRRGLSVDLAAGSAIDNWGGIDVLIGIENVGGSALDDWISGSAVYNALVGNAGNDTLIGVGSAGDYLRGDAGNDSLVGGAGRDSMDAGSGWDVVIGGGGNDQIDGGSGMDIVRYTGARAGFDVVRTVAGYTVTDRSGGEGIDTLVNVERLAFADITLTLDVANALPTGSVTIAGVASQGRTVTASNTLADADGLGTIGYRWQADGVAIPGAEGASLVLGAAQVGKGITVVASYVDDHGITESRASAATAAVAAIQTLVGGPGSDRLTAGPGDDWLTGLAGDDYLDGAGGLDQARLNSARSANTVQRLPDGDVVIRGPEGADTLHGVERAVFNDGAIGFDVLGTGGQCYRLYQAAFDRTPDAGGVGFWMYAVDHGFGLVAAATEFMRSAEFKGLYGENPSNEGFMDLLYRNVMNREPDSGYFFWLDALYGRNGFDRTFSRAEVLVQFSESSENQANVIAVITNGFPYDPFNA